MLNSLLIIINMAICMTIVWTCLCRLNASSSDVHMNVRAYYTLLLTGSLAYGFQAPLFGFIPTPAGVFFAWCVLIGLLMSTARWRNGAPREVKHHRPFSVGQ